MATSQRIESAIRWCDNATGSGTNDAHEVHNLLVYGNEYIIASAQFHTKLVLPTGQSSEEFLGIAYASGLNAAGWVSSRAVI